jgi:hypothetical protein
MERMRLGNSLWAQIVKYIFQMQIEISFGGYVPMLREIKM